MVSYVHLYHNLVNVIWHSKDEVAFILFQIKLIFYLISSFEFLFFLIEYCIDFFVIYIYIYIDIDIFMVKEHCREEKSTNHFPFFSFCSFFVSFFSSNLLKCSTFPNK